jgi:hypothetical protein
MGILLKSIIYKAFKEIRLPKLPPFPIIDQVNLIAFQLQLLKSTKIHLVFHVSLLKPFHESTIPKKTYLTTSMY